MKSKMFNILYILFNFVFISVFLSFVRVHDAQHLTAGIMNDLNVQGH